MVAPEIVTTAEITIYVVIGWASVGLVPNRDRWLSRPAYMHLRGMGQAIVAKGFTTVLFQHSTGRRRPDYDDRIGDGTNQEVVDTASQSFPSGHASMGAVAATYMSLYL